MKDLFLREFDYPLDFTGEHTTLTYEVCEPRAKAGHVSIRKEYDEQGKLSLEYLCLAVRDMGSPAKPTTRKAVFLVRKLNDLVPLPEGAGNLVPPGFLQSSGGRYSYYVFEHRDGDRAIGSSNEETTLSPPAKASATASEQLPEVGCACVVSGPTVHGSEGARTETSEATEPSWWECPDEAPASGL